MHTSFILGFHGCDREVGEELLNGGQFKPSQNAYDWLGSGVYFWEANPLRGLEFIRQVKRRREAKPELPQINEPFVVGAVIELGNCLDMVSSTGVAAVEGVYADFVEYMKAVEQPLPVNAGGDDLLLRGLDCAVLNHLHGVRAKANLPAFDSVRGVFVEGGRVFPTSGFFRKTHIQLCIRNPECIKGVFRVTPEF